MSRYYIPINGYIVIEAESEDDAYNDIPNHIKFSANDYDYDIGTITNLDDCDDND